MEPTKQDADLVKNEALEPQSAVEAIRSVELPSGYSMAVHGPTSAGARLGELELRAPDGRVCLTVVLGPNGPEVRIEAAELSIATRGKLELRAEDLSLVAAKDLSIRAGGALSLDAAGHLETRGFSQAIRATHGDIHVEANDDVRVDGERVRLNAPDAVPLRKREPESEP
jgi:hypothetical protein